MLSTALLNDEGQLSLLQMAVCTTGLGLLWYILSSILAWSKLRQIAGPPVASFSYLWAFFKTNSGYAHMHLEACHEKYGKIFRVGPDAVTTSDPDTIIRLNSARSTYTRGPWYSGARIDPTGDHILNELDPTIHGKLKAKLAPAFRGENLAFLEAKLDKWITSLVGAIRTKVAKGEETMDIGAIIQYFQVDLICDIELGMAWGDLRDTRDHFGFLELNEWFLPMATSMPYIPLARTIVRSNWFTALIEPMINDNNGFGRFIGMIRKEVSTRFENGKGILRENGDLLDIWVKNGVSESECKFELPVLMPAGAETTSIAIRGTLLFLMSSPAVYQRVKQEIRDGIAAGAISNPVTSEEAKNLEYIQAVIREGMRMMPPVTFGFPKRVPASGDTVCGEFLPAGTDVYFSFYSMMRQADVFGPDPHIFRPERFLGTGPEVARMNKVVDAAFGGGRYMCLGKPLAHLELNKIFIELLRNFDFQVASPEKPWTTKVYLSWYISDFRARVTDDTKMMECR